MRSRASRWRARVLLPIVVLVWLGATVLPALAAANIAPTANSQAVAVAFGAPSSLTLTATDPDGPAALTYAIATAPAHGLLGGLNAATGAVTYTPAPGYSGPDSFTFTAADGAATSAPATVAITVSPQPTLALSVGSLGFGDRAVGTLSPAQPVVLTNTSSVPLAITSIATSGDFTRNFTCLAIVAPGEQCTINVSFAPTATGLRTGSLTITSNAVGSPQAVPLGGNGAGESPYVVLTVVKNGEGAVALSPAGTPTGPAGATTYPIGAVVTLTAAANPGAVFTGWAVDGNFAGWANPLDLTLGTSRTITATFAPLPAFSDLPGAQPYSQAVAELAARGTIRGYGDGRSGPGDQVLRAQMAALLARPMGWDGENWGNPFGDQGIVDADLWRNVGAIAHHGVAAGFGDNTFRPIEPVVYSQVISFISRAMVAKGYWVQQPDNPTYYPNVPAASGHRTDLATFVYYAGALPDYPATGPLGPWNQAAPRGWFARALWQALNSYFSVDRVP